MLFFYPFIPLTNSSILVMVEQNMVAKGGKKRAFIVKARNEPSHTFSENHVRHIEMESKKEEK